MKFSIFSFFFFFFFLNRRVFEMSEKFVSLDPAKGVSLRGKCLQKLYRSVLGVQKSIRASPVK